LGTTEPNRVHTVVEAAETQTKKEGSGTFSFGQSMALEGRADGAACGDGRRRRVGEEQLRAVPTLSN